MITYTTTHSTGAVKVRKSKGHTAPRYTHALWGRWTGPTAAGPLQDGRWHCVSIATEATITKNVLLFRNAGNWEVEIAPVTAA